MAGHSVNRGSETRVLFPDDTNIEAPPGLVVELGMSVGQTLAVSPCSLPLSVSLEHDLTEAGNPCSSMTADDPLFIFLEQQSKF